jgi:hypothetical protein
LLLSDAEKATLAEIAQRLGRKVLEELAAVAKPDTLLAGTESSSPTSSTDRDFANESVDRELMRKVVIRPQSRIDPAESPVNTTQVFVTHPSTCWRLGEWNKQGVWLNI